MSSVLTQDNLHIGYNQPFSSYVEKIPNFPDSKFYISLMQDRATRSYAVDWGLSASSSVLRSLKLSSLSSQEEVSVIKNAQGHIRTGTVDLDPAIAELVNENFKSLLWS